MFDFTDDDINGMRQRAQNIFDQINFESKIDTQIDKAIYSAVCQAVRDKVLEIFNNNLCFEKLLLDKISEVINPTNVSLNVFYDSKTKEIINSAVLDKKQDIINLVNSVLQNQTPDEIRCCIRDTIRDYVCDCIFPDKKED